MNNKYTYFNFPLYLLQLTFTLDIQEALDQIISWSIVSYGRRLDLDEEAVVKQLDYMYHRRIDCIPNHIYELLEEYNNLLSQDPFKPELDNEVRYKELSELLNTANYYQEAKELVAITYAAKNLNVELGSIPETIQSYRSAKYFLGKITGKFGGSPSVGIKTAIVFETRNGSFNLDLFRFLCSISSIIGTRKFNRTYKSQISMRMLGAKNQAQLTSLIGKKEPGKVFKKFSTRYQMDKIIDLAVSRKLISKLGTGRGIFVSMRYDINQLGEAIESKRSKYRAIKQAEKEVRESLRQTTLEAQNVNTITAAINNTITNDTIL